MKPIPYFVAVGAAFITMISGAIFVDCRRLVAAAEADAERVDAELRTYEEKYVSSVRSITGEDSALVSAMEAYNQSTSDPLEKRRGAFEDLIAASSSALSRKGVPAAPLERRLADELAGALNRRAIAEKRYDEARGALRDMCASWRGTIGGCVK